MPTNADTLVVTNHASFQRSELAEDATGVSPRQSRFLNRMNGSSCPSTRHLLGDFGTQDSQSLTSLPTIYASDALCGASGGASWMGEVIHPNSLRPPTFATVGLRRVLNNLIRRS